MLEHTIKASEIDLLNVPRLAPDGQLDAPGAQQRQQLRQLAPSLKRELCGVNSEPLIRRDSQVVVRQPDDVNGLLADELTLAVHYQRNLVPACGKLRQLEE